MRQRLLNRLAQRYLLRDDTPRPIVGRPGPNPTDTADWYVEEASVPGTYNLFVAPNRQGALLIDGDSLVLGDVRSISLDEGCWAFDPLGNPATYRFVVSAKDTRLALTATTTEREPNELGLVLRSGRDRGSMWLFGDECVADARSVHLRYQEPADAVLFYNEVYPDQVPPGTFLCTSGFGANARSSDPSGYAGIQQLTDGSRQAIFSVWHRMADEAHPIDRSRATVVAAHPRARVTAFSGEGSGSSIRLPLTWHGTPDHMVRLCVAAEPLGSDTVLTSYVARGDEAWVSLGAIVRAETGGALLNHTYAFIEDFARTGNVEGVARDERSPYRLRSARFTNPWFADMSKRLQPVSHAKFTAYSPHPLENLTAEPISEGEFGVRMATGATLAEREPPIGSSFSDSAPRKRRLPELSGVPHL